METSILKNINIYEKAINTLIENINENSNYYENFLAKIYFDYNIGKTRYLIYSEIYKQKMKIYSKYENLYKKALLEYEVLNVRVEEIHRKIYR